VELLTSTHAGMIAFYLMGKKTDVLGPPVVRARSSERNC
jgi:hypothetical protein